MNIVEMPIGDIIPYENNPRNNAPAVRAVAESIKQFGFQVPIVIDKNNVIVAGHTRQQAALLLGMDSVPCVKADELTEEQARAFRLADNKTAELAEWDFDKLNEELEELDSWDMSAFGFDVKKEIENEIYSQKADIPHYEPTDIKWETSELYDLRKYNELIEEIENSDISEKEKQFLKLSASRHIVFSYGRIADYYAKASADVQRLMERSALVILDIDNAIANGYAKLMEKLNDDG